MHVVRIHGLVVYKSDGKRIKTLSFVRRSEMADLPNVDEAEERAAAKNELRGKKTFPYGVR